MNYHVLDLNKKRDKARVIFHIPVPVENNVADVQLSVALRQYEPTPGSAVPWQQSGVEFDAIQAGTIYEHIETYDFGGKIPQGQQLALLDSRYTTLADDNKGIPTYLRTILAGWGLNRDVP